MKHKSCFKPQGDQGQMGVQGDQGAQGEPGLDGSQGEQGRDGTSGDDVSSIYLQRVVPTWCKIYVIFHRFETLILEYMRFAPKIILFVVPIQIEVVFHVKWFTSRHIRS